MSVSESYIFTEKCDNCQRLDILNMINDALVLVDSQTEVILFMNETALVMYQYTSEESLTLSLKDICHDSGAVNCTNMRMAEQSTKGYVFTSNHRKKDGSIFKVEVSTRYLIFHGEQVFASVVRNLTPDLKMRESIELAGEVQRRSLPNDLDEDWFQIRSIYQPYNYVSGDLYDFFYEKDKDVLHGILIDVMGHGIGAALQTGILKYLFNNAMKKSIPINDKLAWINKEVMPFFAGGDFAGALLFEFDFKCKTLTYSAGGINYIIVLKGQGPEVVKAPGLFLGINEDEVFDQVVCPFQSGESFLFLTDGLFELITQPLNSALDFWGIHKMCKLLATGGDGHDDASGVGILIR